MLETQHFVNRGYGWTCKRCDEEKTTTRVAERSATRARFFNEGESESAQPALSADTLARWRDPSTQQTLVCPRCGVMEGLRDEGGGMNQEG